jgi:hypothetical protein
MLDKVAVALREARLSGETVGCLGLVCAPDSAVLPATKTSEVAFEAHSLGHSTTSAPAM